MKRFSRILLMSLALAFVLAPPVLADELQRAAEQVARQNDARVLSANTVDRGGRSMHVIRILTRDGVVRTVEVPARGGDIRRPERGDPDKSYDREPDRNSDRRRDAPREQQRDRRRPAPRQNDRPRQENQPRQQERNRGGNRSRERRRAS